MKVEAGTLCWRQPHGAGKVTLLRWKTGRIADKRTSTINDCWSISKELDDPGRGEFLGSFSCLVDWGEMDDDYTQKHDDSQNRTETTSCTLHDQTRSQIGMHSGANASHRPWGNIMYGCTMINYAPAVYVP